MCRKNIYHTDGNNSLFCDKCAEVEEGLTSREISTYMVSIGFDVCDSCGFKFELPKSTYELVCEARQQGIKI